MALKGKLILTGGVIVGVALVGLNKMINNKSAKDGFCILNANIKDKYLRDILGLNEEVVIDDNKEDLNYSL